jgi:hypothetical protein
MNVSDEIRRAINDGNAQKVRAMLDGGYDPEAALPNMWTLLSSAARTGHTEVVRELLRSGANPNALNGNNMSALMTGAAAGRLDVVRLLLDSGADPNIENLRGETAISLALGRGHSDVAALITQHGGITPITKEWKNPPLQFVIQRVDGDPSDIQLSGVDFASVLRPTSTASHPIKGWGSHRLVVEGSEVSFSEEPVGFLVVFETGPVPMPRARSIVDEIAANISAHLGVQTSVVEI